MNEIDGNTESFRLLDRLPILEQITQAYETAIYDGNIKVIGKYKVLTTTIYYTTSLYTSSLGRFWTGASAAAMNATVLLDSCNTTTG